MPLEDEVIRVLQGEVQVLKEAQLKMERLVADLHYHDEKQQTMTDRVLADLSALNHILRGEDGSGSLIVRFALAERLITESAQAIKDAAARRWDLVKGIVVGVALIVAGIVIKMITDGPK